ncbi:ABC transporter permease [Pseudodesulfovibrio piezophilus]|uniref:Uncharacterized protein n=1 Tax=Pseudodesulfovibrio piezophilus (strain DSM 21447 / JCM 15486 / C1TLV30) TaxID=1322246 RepID=M1WLU8_PSEP2|nr:ABC transporter permease [Pseudodesulfovibrio piezophilus]CCH48485.1 conserved membrane protein of unknown function [Pseudodesulfovibrio piezophilus C1TLV30]
MSVSDFFFRGKSFFFPHALPGIQENIPSSINVWAIFPRILKLSLKALWVFKARTLFILLAVALGVGALTIITAAMEGASKKAEEMAETFGPSAIFVAGGNLMYQPMGNRPRTLTWNDIERIRTALPGVVSVQPFLLREKMHASATSRRHIVASVVGSGKNYQATWNWDLQDGEDFSAHDVASGASVCLLGTLAARGLFGSQNPVGKIVTLEGTPLIVRGVLTPRNIVAAGVEQDDRLVLPASTMLRRFNLDRKYLNGIRINFASTRNMKGNALRVQALMRNLHGIEEGGADDFLVISPLVVLQFVSFLRGGFGVFLGVTALAALLVGGVILANLFHLSVTERQVEIGIKKAVGASDSSILLQFLMEACALTLMGAVFGLMLGVVLSDILAEFDMLELKLSATVFATACLAALVVAFAFGLKPARRAAQLEPVLALKEGR